MPQNIKDMLGVQPELRRYLAQLETGLSGSLVLVLDPATLGDSAAAVATAIAGDGFSRDVVVELQDANGDLQDWFSGTRAIAVADVTAGNGTSAIKDSATTVQFVNGRGVVTIDYVGTWAAADTNTLTVTGGTILGYTVSNKTSVDTLVA
jgi:hypothetical protein